MVMDAKITARRYVTSLCCDAGTRACAQVMQNVIEVQAILLVLNVVYLANSVHVAKTTSISVVCLRYALGIDSIVFYSI
eukprot:6176988-Pleurochrysis_carterae.AAC.7